MLSKELTKDNLYKYLKELSKEYKKIGGRKMPAEIIIIGGASVLINYGFRESTEDIDAIIEASSAMKDAIYKVAERNDLPDKWLNDDFKYTDSYSSKLVIYSKYYTTYSNIVSIRTVNAEYLLAMKLKSDRTYKHDFSDVIGIIDEERKRGNIITKEDIIRASKELFGDKFELSEEGYKCLDRIYSSDNLHELFNKVKMEEAKDKERIQEIIDNNAEPGKRINAKELLKEMKKKYEEK